MFYNIQSWNNILKPKNCIFSLFNFILKDFSRQKAFLITECQRFAVLVSKTIHFIYSHWKIRFVTFWLHYFRVLCEWNWYNFASNQYDVRIKKRFVAISKQIEIRSQKWDWFYARVCVDFKRYLKNRRRYFHFHAKLHQLPLPRRSWLLRSCTI
jgi:hypothetical protein